MDGVPTACYVGGFDDPYDFRKRRFQSTFDVAYAITTHKAQGTQAPYVVVVLDGTFLSRKLLYTAMSRAERKLILFADPGQIIKATTERSVPPSPFLLKLKRAFGRASQINAAKGSAV